MISMRVTQKGSKIDDWLRKKARGDFSAQLSQFGEQGVRALSAATPVETGESARSWHYRVTKSRGGWKLEWYNTHTTSTGVPIVILVQYGHGTRGGTYLAGRDFINPTMRPVFDRIVREIWEKVRNG